MCSASLSTFIYESCQVIIAIIVLDLVFKHILLLLNLILVLDVFPELALVI